VSIVKLEKLLISFCIGWATSGRIVYLKNYLGLFG